MPDKRNALRDPAQLFLTNPMNLINGGAGICTWVLWSLKPDPHPDTIVPSKGKNEHRRAEPLSSWDAICMC